MAKDLTFKQLTFCEKYIISRNAKKASLDAGYSESYSNKKSYELLKDDRIKNKIAELEELFFDSSFKRLAVASITALESLIGDDVIEERVKLQAVKEIFKLSGIENRVTQNTSSDNSLQIHFNEVRHRD